MREGDGYTETAEVLVLTFAPYFRLGLRQSVDSGPPLPLLIPQAPGARQDLVGPPVGQILQGLLKPPAGRGGWMQPLV